jgi:hypothetical protein
MDTIKTDLYYSIFTNTEHSLCAPDSWHRQTQLTKMVKIYQLSCGHDKVQIKMWPSQQPTVNYLTERSLVKIPALTHGQLHMLVIYTGHAAAQWLRHRATNWKVAGSIPNGVIGIFHWDNSSSRTMALGSTQPPTEMSTRNISWG